MGKHSQSDPQNVVVIAADRSYGWYALNLVGSIQANSDIFDQIIVYDLGLSRLQRSILAGVQKVALQKVDHFVSHWRQCWSWKPWIWANTRGKTVLYLDAGLTVLQSLRPVVEQIDKMGYFVVSEDLPVGPTIPRDYYQLYGLPPQVAKQDCIAAGILGFKPEGRFLTEVIKPILADVRLGRNLGWSVGEASWRNAGLNKQNNPPIRDCPTFRHDQTLLNIHFYLSIKDPVVEPHKRFHWKTPRAAKDQLIWHHRRSSGNLTYTSKLKFTLDSKGLLARQMIRAWENNKYLNPMKYLGKARKVFRSAK